MTNSSSKPEKTPGHCPACNAPVSVEPSRRNGREPCPQCGTLLWFCKQWDGIWFHDAEKLAPVRRRLLAIVTENLGVNEREIRDTTSFMKDMGADTLDVVEFVIEIEKEFQITIPDAHAERLTTVGELLDYVLRQQR